VGIVETRETRDRVEMREMTYDVMEGAQRRRLDKKDNRQIADSCCLDGIEGAISAMKAGMVGRRKEPEVIEEKVEEKDEEKDQEKVDGRAGF